MGETFEPFVSPASAPAASSAGEVPFEAHAELLEFFVSRRAEIVERIEALLNAQRKPIEHLRDRRLLARQIEDGFFAAAGITRDQARLRGRLEQAHWEAGFKPREIPGMHNDLVDPAEMMRRGFHLWSQTRWPGRNGRARYAQTLFDLYVVRHVALLSMRVWDAGPSSASARLSQARRVLDALWKTTPPDQPVLVRDARWLIPVAQSPATEELSPYFEVAEKIADGLAEDDATEVHKAVVRMAGGHLRSYLHYYVTQKGAALDGHGLLSGSRKANALDFSLLIYALVPLLAAYERAVHGGDGTQRLDLADAICQGISPDPDLFVNHADLLGVYSMIEHFFTAEDEDGRAVYTPAGRRHVQLLEEYAARIARIVKPLYEDCLRFRPAAGEYSPYGVLFGFSSNLLEHMALKTLQADPAPPFSLEDVFTAGGADKLAWVGSWRKLPHVDAEIQKLYDYPHAFAEQMFARIERALHAGATRGDSSAAARTGRLFVEMQDGPLAASSTAEIRELPASYFRSSDAALVAAHKAEAQEETDLLRDRIEAHFVVSYETPGGWAAITKDFLTEVLGAGEDAKIAALPQAAAERLTLMCLDLVARRRGDDRSSS